MKFAWNNSSKISKYLSVYLVIFLKLTATFRELSSTQRINDRTVNLEFVKDI